MNLLLLDEDDFVGPHRAVVHGRRAEHIIDVLHATPGAQLRAGRIDGLIGFATIAQLTSSHVELDVVLSTPAPPPLDVHLALALPRPKVLARILSASASMGVKKISLINAWKVDKSYWKSPALEPDAIRRQLLLGLEQAVDTVLPQVTLHRFFRRWAETDLAAQIAHGVPVFVAHPGSRDELRPDGAKGSCILVIGPEGGLLPGEVDMLTRIGAVPVHAGERILRVETAIPWLLSRLSSTAVHRQ